jgi:hypothetical protein
MAVFPLIFWETIRDEVNEYAEFKISKRHSDNKVKRPKLIASHQWIPAMLDEIMTFLSYSYTSCFTHRKGEG